MTLKLKISFLIILSGTNVFCQNIPQRLDTFFNSLNKYNQINGGVLVAENGSVLYKKAFGFADFENKIPNDKNTKFTLASVSKIFTSTAILQLRDKGKLKLDDPFMKYFSDFPYPDITLRNLLSHTSGLPDYNLYEDQINKNPNKIFSNKDILPSLKLWNKPLSFKPGEKWEYSNTNFCLLALLVEKLSDLVFEEYLQKFIFNPAKMNDTYFQADILHSNDKNRSNNYEYPFLYSPNLENVDSLKKYRWRLYNASGFVGQGNIITTTQDLLKFDNLLYAGNILKSTTLTEAFTPTKLKSGMNANANVGMGKASYALGWFIFADTSLGKIVWHTGGQPGGLSIFLRNITKKQTVIMFDNAFHKNLYGDGVNVMSILNNKPVVIYKKSLTKDYGCTLVEKGIDAAYCKLEELKADSAHYYLSEEDTNDLGLQLLYEPSFKGHDELSLEVLKLNTLLFPNSFNTYDSYGEALAKTGKKDEAIFMYRKSVKLNPQNDGGKKALEELQKK
ncbi:MAG: serine hydrolase domain-containing protein [Segetibacter sp.]